LAKYWVWLERGEQSLKNRLILADAQRQRYKGAADFLVDSLSTRWWFATIGPGKFAARSFAVYFDSNTASPRIISPCLGID
jgi:hypothetical protein